MSKPSKPLEEIDVSAYAELVNESFKAFGTHYHYAEAIILNANTMERRRKNGSERMQWRNLTGQTSQPKGWKLEDAIAQVMSVLS